MIALEFRDVERNGVTKGVVDVTVNGQRRFTDRVTADSSVSRDRFARKAAKTLVGAAGKPELLEQTATEIEKQLSQMVDMELHEEDESSDQPNASAGEPASQNQAATVPIGSHDPSTGKLVLSAKRTLPTANAYIGEFHPNADGRTIHHYAGNMLVWERNRSTPLEDGAIVHRLQSWLHDALRYQLTKDGVMQLVPFESNSATVESALKSIKARVHLSATIAPPAWLDGRTEPEPRDLLATPSGNLHVPTGIMHPPTPALFNLTAIDFEYEDNPEPAERWTKFLAQPSHEGQ